MVRTLALLALLVAGNRLPAQDVPLENCDLLPVVQVRISGMKFLFLVDTAAVSILNAGSFAHGDPTRVTVQSWSGTTETDGKDVTVGDLAIGERHLRNVRLRAVDLSAIGRGCGRRIDGILGMDLLGQLGLIVDLKNHTARFLPDPETAQARLTELQRQLAECERAFNRGDEVTLADCLDPQVVIFTTAGDYRGRAAAMDYFRNRYFGQHPSGQLVMTVRGQHPIGEAIWIEYDLRIALGDGAFVARGTALCQKLDGRWRIAHMNHSNPPAIGPQRSEGALKSSSTPESRQ